MGAYSRLLGVGLFSTVAVGACLSDVEYLRNGETSSDAGEPSSQSGSGGSSGNGGVFPTGGFGNAGMGGTSGSNTGEAGETGESGAGGSGVVEPGTPCEGIVPLFTFNEPNVVTNLNTGPKQRWSRGPYDSTNTLTGDIDTSANPPSNVYNLANKSLLMLDSKNGNPDQAMSFSIPISPTVFKTQIVNVLYVFAAYAEKGAAVDMSRANLVADVTLGSAPHANCKMTVTPWTTGTNSEGTTFVHQDGPPVTVTAAKWTQVKMDLATSKPPTAVNQYGFVLKTSCTKPPPMGEGGAGGMDAGGADGGGTSGSGGTGGNGGNGGSGGYSGPPTVVLFDNIETTCN
jgi:hypothetical protein